MNQTKKMFLLLVSVLTITSCEDVLDTDNLGAYSEDTVYSDPDLLERVVFSAYNSTEGWALNKTIWWSRRYNIEAGSFEAKFNFRDLDRLRLRGNGWTAQNEGDFRNKWRDNFRFINEINQFLDNVDDSQAMADDPEKVNSLKAEMKFLRANIYTKMIKMYGGVPIFTTAFGLDSDFDVTRNTYEECVDFIVKELDEAAAVLPETRPAGEFGRATKLAALAVKSRTLLFAASSLHDSSTEPSGPLYDYSKATKWQDAADAAKEIIDIVGAKDLIATPDAQSYRNLFLSPNEDILFARAYGGDLYDFGLDANSLIDQTQSPPGYGGWAISSPSHNFALEFNMADGTSTDGATFDPADPNANREMRYYAILNFQGANFRGRPIDYALSPDNPALHGLDSPEGSTAGSPGNDLHSSKTGYNIRKFHNESLASINETTPGRPYILYRLAEIYLNYAEAKAELGDEVEALAFLNKVSTRALQPEITASGTDLLEAIKRERRIELAFEGHNFWDERRWMNTEHLGFDIKGLQWEKDATGNLTHTEYTVVTRPWFDKQYYLPIPNNEILKAPSLIQNAGY
ncbi:RagB/SusD family nutrient uptake outer membrane protein [Maribacter algarum]|uniref:RagB/SusD family nutrient uptake outer membrane protein n=1 Tax=Maribacter algarum (ex Zhang et al. 2020) TaxID=2578118 RepID=A0A5S3PSV3_9FLAO|nr:RagB/SusD family nutrient uptake outer membrane protein [Maribacter algarum]TMM55760.1 RagB/SusD family nutrient uptake outer membrane protein [Maribacter algarum]